MFANVRKKYVFKTIDPALICVFGAMLLGMMGGTFAVVRYFANRKS